MRVQSKLLGALAAVVLLGGCASTGNQLPPERIVTPQVLRVPASNSRQLELRVWAVEAPRAVVVFSAGGGGQPADYARMLQAVAAQGFTVVAPVHSDALSRGDLSGSAGPASFAARIEDLAIARGYAGGTQAGLPVVVMGHSFGSLMSSLAVGAATPAGPQTDPAVKAFIAFSSPGIVPGLLTSQSYRDLVAPVLVVTGQADLVPGFVTDWRSHRAIYDQSSVPGSALVVFDDAEHNLIVDGDDERFQALVELIATFIDAHALGDAAARTRLSERDLRGATIERR